MVQRRSANALLLMLLAMTMTGCATVSKFHPDQPDEQGSLRLVQVTSLASRDQIEKSGMTKHLVENGVRDSDIRELSVGAARAYCCGHPAESAMAMFVYIPPNTSVEVGDIVEVRMGREPGDGRPGVANTVTRVRQKKAATTPSCRWVPPDHRMWMRILYCDWMPQEGWVEKTGLHKTWLKPTQTADR